MNLIKLISMGALLLSGFMRTPAIKLDETNELVSAISDSIKNNQYDICRMLEAKALCKSNLGIPREKMPQLTSDVAEKYYSQKNQTGCQVDSLIVSADQLNPTQSDMHGGAILKLYQQAKQGGADPCKQEILVAVALEEPNPPASCCVIL